MLVEALKKMVERLDEGVGDHEVGLPFFSEPRYRVFPLSKENFKQIERARKEQLFKVREILNEMQCPQVVMVSHERELESFADHIFRVEKREGISGIEAA